jgi:hypothetical protein
MSNCTETINAEVTKMTEDEIYKQNIEKLMLAGSSEMISNNLPQHASALLSCFFRHATSEVKIVCNTLRRSVYDTPEVLSSMLAAGRRGIPIQVLVRNTPEEGSVFLTRFNELMRAQPTKFSLLPDAVTHSKLVKEQKENFSIMDAKAFRFEKDTDNCHAVACMNFPSLAAVLSNTFDRLYASTSTGLSGRQVAQTI